MRIRRAARRGDTPQYENGFVVGQLIKTSGAGTENLNQSLVYVFEQSSNGLTSEVASGSVEMMDGSPAIIPEFA